MAGTINGEIVTDEQGKVLPLGSVKSDGIL